MPPSLNYLLSLFLFMSTNMPDPLARNFVLSLSMCYRYVLKFILVLFCDICGNISLFRLAVKDLLSYLFLGHLKFYYIFYICYAFFLKLAIISIPFDYRVGFSLTDSLAFFYSMGFLRVYLNEYCLSFLL